MNIEQSDNFLLAMLRLECYLVGHMGFILIDPAPLALKSQTLLPHSSEREKHHGKQEGVSGL